MLDSEVDDRLIEAYIKETCESAIMLSYHPNSMVCINLQEMQDCGGVCFHVVTFRLCFVARDARVISPGDTSESTEIHNFSYWRVPLTRRAWH